MPNKALASGRPFEAGLGLDSKDCPQPFVPAQFAGRRAQSKVEGRLNFGMAFSQCPQCFGF